MVQCLSLLGVSLLGVVLLIFTWCSVYQWLRGVVVITTAELHSTKPELRLCTGSNPAGSVSDIRDGEDL